MLKEVDIKNIEIMDSFWKNMQEKVKSITLPYQFEVLNDSVKVNVEAERKDENLPSGKSHAIKNLLITAGLVDGDHFGWVFQDTDVYKWIESVSYFLMMKRDKELENKVDLIVDIIEKAQEKDGYINTYYQCRSPHLRYRELYRSHELYCAGHLIEAAIAYDQATNKNKLLKIAIKFAENIKRNFGRESEQLQIADGHQEIEIALVKLYEYTSDESYLELAKFFIDIRGENINAFQEEVNRLYEENLSNDKPKINVFYHQAHKKPENQTEAVGHAVRLLYMTIAMAKIVQNDMSAPLYDACLVLWKNIVKYKMYITGGVGSTVHGEAFTGKYDLPNDTMYCETCASIALINFALELFKLNPKTEYLEVIEKALYNTIIASISTDGKHFFYVNPLEVEPVSCHYNPSKGHVKLKRPDWLGCACCPPNFTRTIGALGKFIASYSDDINYLNLLIPSKIKYFNGDLELKKKAEYPEYYLKFNGKNTVVKVYLPNWLHKLKVEVKQGNYLGIENGFMVFETKTGSIEVKFEGKEEIIANVANPYVIADAHKVAIQKGPFIYCAEEIDNEKSLHRYLIELSKIEEASEQEQSEYKKICLNAKKLKIWQCEELYQYLSVAPEYEDAKLTMIPYFLWGNRNENEMRIWFNYL